MMKLIAIGLLLTLAVSGCSAVGAAGGYVVDRVGERLDGAVGEYCEADADTRAAIRDRVASTIDPNRIVVECAGDD